MWVLPLLHVSWFGVGFLWEVMSLVLGVVSGQQRKPLAVSRGRSTRISQILDMDFCGLYYPQHIKKGLHSLVMFWGQHSDTKWHACFYAGRWESLERWDLVSSGHEGRCQEGQTRWMNLKGGLEKPSLSKDEPRSCEQPRTTYIDVKMWHLLRCQGGEESDQSGWL